MRGELALLASAVRRGTARRVGWRSASRARSRRVIADRVRPVARLCAAAAIRSCSRSRAGATRAVRSRWSLRPRRRSRCTRSRCARPGSTRRSTTASTSASRPGIRATAIAPICPGSPGRRSSRTAISRSSRASRSPSRADVLFHSDSEGFRNDADYAGEPWVLIGDSFVVGVGSSQPDILSARLAARGVHAYNLAHPGGPLDYESYWRSFVARARPLVEAGAVPVRGQRFSRDGRRARALRLVGRARSRRARRGRAAHAPRDLSRDAIARRALHQARRARRRRRWRSVRSRARGSRSGTASRATRARPSSRTWRSPTRRSRASRPTSPPSSSSRPSTACTSAGSRPRSALPNASWQHLARLCEEYRVPCTDLTPALVSRSEALLAEGRFTWWRDDTHWNGEGIDAAAARVAEVLARSKDGRADEAAQGGPPRDLRAAVRVALDHQPLPQALLLPPRADLAEHALARHRRAQVSARSVGLPGAAPRSCGRIGSSRPAPRSAAARATWPRSATCSAAGRC